MFGIVIDCIKKLEASGATDTQIVRMLLWAAAARMRTAASAAR